MGAVAQGVSVCAGQQACVLIAAHVGLTKLCVSCVWLRSTPRGNLQHLEFFIMFLGVGESF